TPSSLAPITSSRSAFRTDPRRYRRRSRVPWADYRTVPRGRSSSPPSCRSHVDPDVLHAWRPSVMLGARSTTAGGGTGCAMENGGRDEARQNADKGDPVPGWHRSVPVRLRGGAWCLRGIPLRSGLWLVWWLGGGVLPRRLWG